MNPIPAWPQRYEGRNIRGRPVEWDEVPCFSHLRRKRTRRLVFEGCNNFLITATTTKTITFDADTPSTRLGRIQLLLPTDNYRDKPPPGCPVPLHHVLMRERVYGAFSMGERRPLLDISRMVF